MEITKPYDTPMPTCTKIEIDEYGKNINDTMHRGMIRSLLYLSLSHPIIVFNVGLCARFQCKPKESPLATVKKDLEMLEGNE